MVTIIDTALWLLVTGVQDVQQKKRAIAQKLGLLHKRYGDLHRTIAGEELAENKVQWAPAIAWVRWPLMVRRIHAA